MANTDAGQKRRKRTPDADTFEKQVGGNASGREGLTSWHYWIKAEERIKKTKERIERRLKKISKCARKKNRAKDQSSHSFSMMVQHFSGAEKEP